MADEVQPVLHHIFEIADNTGKISFDRPIALQITKFKPTANGHTLRVSDGQYTMASMLQPDLETSFAEVGRIVRLTQYEVGCTDPKEPGNDATRRVYLNIFGWSDIGPESKIVGSPTQMNGTHVSGNGYLVKRGVVPSTEPAQTGRQDAAARNNYEANGTTGADSSNPKLNKAKQISIESLSCFISNWKLLVRVTKKSDIREFVSKTTNNNGRLFNVTFNDETGDIAATGFSEAVDKYYNKIVEGQQYYISNFTVKDANKRFNQTSHNYELYFTNDTVIEPAQDTEKQLPSVFFKFVSSIADLANHKVNSNVDVVGVATKVGESQIITSKSSSIPYTKRDLQLLDDSGRTITLTLWGNDAENFNSPEGTVVAVKGARLSDFNGLSLSATRAAVIYTDPDEKRAHKLKGWYQATGGSDVKVIPISDEKQDSGSQNSKSSPRLTIGQVLTNGLGRSGQPDYFEIKARILSIGQRTIAYPACTIGDCKKKVIEESDGRWRCEKSEATIDEPQWRYILSLTLSDPTSEEIGIQVSAFDEIGRLLYGDRAKEFVDLQQAGGGAGEFNRELANALRCIQGKEYIWSIKGTIHRYNDEEKARYTVLSAREPDPFTEGSLLLSQIGF